MVTQLLEQEDTLLTVREVAKLLRVDATTVKRWINNGALNAVELPHVSNRTTHRVKSSVLEKLMGGK